ncbi:CHY zinc finger protein [Corynebacterium halotolerans]|uniref:CHY zinc finger protein n=1 Tax=Corynebacterium halotolerans TaxID=225326 RepID=UPI003CF4B557
MGVRIRGTAVDGQGRCAHYHSEWDIIANRCATCDTWWACFRCHRDHADHPFGRVVADSGVTGARCGACGHEMNYAEYSAATRCLKCGHPFNPGCAAHAPLYFEL